MQEMAGGRLSFVGRAPARGLHALGKAFQPCQFQHLTQPLNPEVTEEENPSISKSHVLHLNLPGTLQSGQRLGNRH